MALSKQLSKCKAISDIYFSFEMCVWPYHVDIKYSFVFYKTVICQDMNSCLVFLFSVCVCSGLHVCAPVCADTLTRAYMQVEVNVKCLLFSFLEPISLSKP